MNWCHLEIVVSGGHPLLDKHDLTSSKIKLDVYKFPDSKVHGANMGPTWGRQDPGGPHVGPINFAIYGAM